MISYNYDTFYTVYYLFINHNIATEFSESPLNYELRIKALSEKNRLLLFFETLKKMGYTNILLNNEKQNNNNNNNIHDNKSSKQTQIEFIIALATESYCAGEIVQFAKCCYVQFIESTFIPNPSLLLVSSNSILSFFFIKS